MTETTGTRKGIIRVTQVACIEVDLDKFISNVFPLGNKNQSVTSLEDLIEVFKNNASTIWDWDHTTEFDVTNATIVDPVVQEQVETLRQTAKAALAEANLLIKSS